MVKEDKVFKKINEGLFFANTAEHGLEFDAAGVLFFKAFPFMEEFIFTAEGSDFGMMTVA